METLEEFSGCYLPGHDGVLGAEGLEALEHLAELADLDADAVGIGERVVEGVRGFPLKGDEP
jgi:hypothetical protein